MKKCIAMFLRDITLNRTVLVSPPFPMFRNGTFQLKMFDMRQDGLKLNHLIFERYVTSNYRQIRFANKRMSFVAFNNFKVSMNKITS